MMESIHTQTWTDIEHIIIDGGSNDGTLEILEKYRKKGWITTLVSKKDSGIYHAMNKGIKLSRGEFIHIMNTDDYFIDNNYFRKCMDILQTATNIDFTHADKLIISKSGKPDRVKKGDIRVAFFRMPFRHQTMVIRRRVFDEIGLFDENYSIAADYKFVLKMLLSGKEGHYFAKTVLVSLDGGASSNRKTCIQEVSKAIYETYGKNNNLTIDDCKNIYTRRISSALHKKILFNVHNKQIVDSLNVCYTENKK
jgi:glycosyltransferase